MKKLVLFFTSESNHEGCPKKLKDLCHHSNPHVFLLVWNSQEAEIVDRLPISVLQKEELVILVFKDLQPLTEKQVQVLELIKNPGEVFLACHEGRDRINEDNHLIDIINTVDAIFNIKARRLFSRNEETQRLLETILKKNSEEEYQANIKKILEIFESSFLLEKSLNLLHEVYFLNSKKESTYKKVVNLVSAFLDDVSSIYSDLFPRSPVPKNVAQLRNNYSSKNHQRWFIDLKDTILAPFNETSLQ